MLLAKESVSTCRNTDFSLVKKNFAGHKNVFERCCLPQVKHHSYIRYIVDPLSLLSAPLREALEKS